MINFRDIEQLSAYLDGQLNSTESTRLESRIASDPQLASALNDIRAARGILRKMPARKAPRNFTLTRKMVGLKPPLPQSYSFFRFSTAIATTLLILTFAANALPNLSFGAGAPAPYSFGGGGASAAATEAPAAEAPSLEMGVAPTESLPAANSDSSRIGETPPVEAPMSKEPVTASTPLDQPQAGSEVVIPVMWQIILLVICLVSAAITFIIDQKTKKKWS